MLRDYGFRGLKGSLIGDLVFAMPRNDKIYCSTWTLNGAPHLFQDLHTEPITGSPKRQVWGGVKV